MECDGAIGMFFARLFSAFLPAPVPTLYRKENNVMSDFIQRSAWFGLGQAMLVVILSSVPGFSCAQSSTSLQAPSGPNTAEQKQQLRSNRGDNQNASGKPSIDTADMGMMRRMAEAHYAEIQQAALAQQISADAKVKAFAQTLLDDHYAALADLRKLAEAKGAILPGGAGKDDATTISKLARLTGKEFDQQFISNAGVSAHDRAVKLFEEAANRTKDEDLKAYATKYLKPLTGHLKAAQQLQEGDQPVAAAGK
jgi:putative membrane protein